jgi:hypothetical protein
MEGYRSTNEVARSRNERHWNTFCKHDDFVIMKRFLYATINAIDNQRSVWSTLITINVSFNFLNEPPKMRPMHVIGDPNAAHYSTVITISVVQDLNEKIADVDCMMR